MDILYRQASSSVEIFYEVKKSKFITRIHPIEDRAAAMLYLQQAKNDYPDARHYCWAYLLGSPSQPKSQAFNDDGEPSGTAGKPILNVLNHGKVGDIIVIVIRYFGGIKLGVGGLVRAYSTATQLAINNLSTIDKIAMFTVTLDMDFSQENKCRHFLKQHQGIVLEQIFTKNLQLRAQLPVEEKKSLIAFAQGLHIRIETIEDE